MPEPAFNPMPTHFRTEAAIAILLAGLTGPEARCGKTPDAGWSDTAIHVNPVRWLHHTMPKPPRTSCRAR